MLNTIPLDPDLPRQRRGFGSGLFYSALCIAGALFAAGRLHAVDAMLSQLNTSLHAHNDQIVDALVRMLPFCFVGIGSFGLVYKTLGVLNKAGRSA